MGAGTAGSSAVIDLGAGVVVVAVLAVMTREVTDLGTFISHARCCHGGFSSTNGAITLLIRVVVVVIWC